MVQRHHVATHVHATWLRMCAYLCSHVCMRVTVCAHVCTCVRMCARVCERVISGLKHSLRIFANP